MGTQRATELPMSTESEKIAKLRSQYGCGPIEFAGTANALYERHLVFDDVIDLGAAGSVFPVLTVDPKIQRHCRHRLARGHPAHRRPLELSRDVQ